ncbi:MAG: GNAT family N-acetyltransferase [Chloroflexi bacterium]|nr:GNAT family N-acetyltransferase [Chloroflexota bacterium]
MLDEKLFGIYVDGELRGVACIEVPQAKHSFGKTLAFVVESIKPVFKMSLRRFILLNNYMKTTLSSRPEDPHHYLVLIGVDPALQKQGAGRALLDHTHQLVKSNSNSIGIGLDTENHQNVPFYEHFGYELTGTELLDLQTGDAPRL